MVFQQLNPNLFGLGRESFSVVGGFFFHSFIDERMKKKIPGMYVIAVLMPYISSSFVSSANLEGSGNFALLVKGNPHQQRAAPPKNSGLLRTE